MKFHNVLEHGFLGSGRVEYVLDVIVDTTKILGELVNLSQTQQLHRFREIIRTTSNVS